jgi:hypothetical protein
MEGVSGAAECGDLFGLKILCDRAVNRLTGFVVVASPPGWRGVNPTFERSLKMNKFLAALIAVAFSAGAYAQAPAKKDEKKADKPAAAASAASAAKKK